jgi:hypothetical protein
MADPTKPEMAGKFWLPGMNAAAEEVPDWPLPHGRFGLHHPIVHGDVAYCSWRDACLAIIDVSDRHAPKLIAHKVWSPPFGGGTHNALPLPGRDLLVVVDETVLDHGEDGIKPIWIMNNQLRGNPIPIATCPAPRDRDCYAVGGHFGPHNIHENRPGSFVSEDLIFATYQNAGVRVYDIRDPFRPEEVGACVPAAPARLCCILQMFSLTRGASLTSRISMQACPSSSFWADCALYRPLFGPLEIPFQSVGRLGQMSPAFAAFGQDDPQIKDVDQKQLADPSFQIIPEQRNRWR